MQYLIKLNVLDLNNNQISEIKWISNLTDLGKLYLSNNLISFIDQDLFDNFSYLWLIDLSHNRIKQLESFGTSLILSHIDLSFNELSNVSFLFKYRKTKTLIINSNRITHFDLPVYLTLNKDITMVNLSMNQINQSESIKDLNIRLNFIFIDKNYENLYSKIKNNRSLRNNVGSYSFLLSLFIVTPIDYSYGNCSVKLDYLKRNIHFNLFYQFQIDNFVFDCLNFLNYYSF